MKRRDFIQNIIPAAVLPNILGKYSVKTMEDSPFIRALLGTNVETDHVLVLVRLDGGNDGLNMVIPVDQYSNYFNARTNIAIPQNKILSLNGTAATGLHPSMAGLQSLYNQGKASIIQAVSYPTPNFSHFRATDIWMSASDSDQIVNSGWMGRYLNNEYPNFPIGYPNAIMPDPLGIQIGSITSLALQGPSVSMGMSITDPVNFYNLINGVQDPVPATPAGKELSYVRLVAQQTNQYAVRIKAAAANIPSQSTYPTNNSLADQLKIVARLVAGGLKTRVYMVSIGGFDNHSGQVNIADVTTGAHATLLQKISDSVKAFMDDLKFLGVESRVIGMTFSEFGRRIKSNSSTGTDHGAAAPMILFGSNITPGILGTNPIIPASATVNDNVPMQYDFRSIYASILENWFCVNSTDLQTIMLKNFQSLPIVNGASCKATGIDDINRGAGISLINNYPNPFVESTTISFKTKGGHTLIQVIDTLGRVINTLVEKDYLPGDYKITFNSYGLPAGVYYARLQNGQVSQVKAMLKVR